MFLNKKTAFFCHLSHTYLLRCVDTLESARIQPDTAPILGYCPDTARYVSRKYPVIY